MVVAVRSGGYGAEWSSNMFLGAAGDHAGFDEASGKVYNYLADYVNSSNITGKVKFWVTGFSRGGATANLLAAKLNNTADEHPAITYTKEDVFAYTFATPAGAAKSSNPHSSAYNNIFNIIHYHDIVPLVAPSQTGWSFDRYGITKVLPYHESAKWTSNYESRMKQYLSDMGYTYKVTDFKSYIGIPVVAVNYLNHDSLGTYNRKLINSLATNMINRYNYVALYQNKLMSLMSKNAIAQGSAVTSELNIATQDLLRLLTVELVTHPHISTTLAMNLNLLAIVHSEDANYLAWMMSMDPNYDASNTPYFTNGDYRAVKVNCPVDVYVYDNEDNLVASIVNEEPQEITGSSIISSIDENGQKVVYLPCDADYRVEVIAREDCDTTYTINEMTGAYSEVARVVTTQLEMAENEVLASEIETYSDAEVESGAENGTDLAYQTALSNTVVTPDVDIAGEEVEAYTYTVTATCDETQGTVSGGGSFTIGDFCQVTAGNQPGYKFRGWYIADTMVSAESTYRFAVTENTQLEARYDICEHPAYSAESVAATCSEQGYTAYTCSICGYTYYDHYTDKLPHSYDGGVISKNATCTEAGTISYSCTVCNETYSQSIPATGHNFGSNSAACLVCGTANPNYVAPAPQIPFINVQPMPEPTITAPSAPNTANTSAAASTATTAEAKPAGAKKVDGVWVNTKYKKPNIKKLKKAKKAFKVTWKKVSGVKGYQIQYSTSKKFTKKKTQSVTIKNNKAKNPSKTIKKLKSKKKYYVRVRTYKTVKVNGKSVKVYSKWSSVKSVKTK